MKMWYTYIMEYYSKIKKHNQKFRKMPRYNKNSNSEGKKEKGETLKI